MSKRQLRKRRARADARPRGATRAAAAVLGGVAGLLPALGTAQPAAASGDTAVRFADPDTYWPGGDWDYTFGTSLPDDACGAEDADGERTWVPYIRTPRATASSGSTLSGKCLSGDAMPSGPGPWARQDRDIWAPTVSFYAGSYHLHYTAMKQGTGQACLGRATSKSINGPYTGQTEFACPPAGRWALDADTIVHDDRFYLTYRDDYVTTGSQTGISIVELNTDGSAQWDTRVTALLSQDVGWEYAGRTDTHVVENPAIVPWSDGRFYLFFSGNDYATPDYATGIADCGTKLLDATRCTPLIDANRPYFGYSGASHSPWKTLPGDHPGPGGMSPWRASDGSWRATWHWRSDFLGFRYAKNDRLQALDPSTSWLVG